MSHFTKIKTKIIETEFLLKALEDLELPFEVGNVAIRGWGGQRKEVDIKIPTRNNGYDIGFVKNGESYEIVADWYGIEEFNRDRFVERIHQRYTYQATVATLARQGFSIVRDESHAEGQIHLTLRRMA